MSDSCNEKQVLGTDSIDIVHVMGSIDADAAGPSYSVPRLCRALAELKHAVRLISGTAQRGVLLSRQDGYTDHRYPLGSALPGVGKLGLSTALRDGIFTAAATADVLHTHGLWRFANVYPATAARRYSRPLVLSPRGMLAPSALEFSALSKRLFWALRQRNAVCAVSAFHATSDQEYQDIRAYGLEQPVAVIPNGIDIPPTLTSVNRTEGEVPIVLFLGRLHRVKAIDRLVNAWHLLGEAQSHWRLVIVGPAEQAHDQELLALIRSLGLSNVEVRGPVQGDEKWRLLQRAELTVLPSLSENFGVSVAESLAAGTPVIASRGTPWHGLQSHACGWWVDNAPECLAKVIGEALQLSVDERSAMGMRGRVWMEREFSWRGIAIQFVDVYTWLGGGDLPTCVRMN